MQGIVVDVTEAGGGRGVVARAPVGGGVGGADEASGGVSPDEPAQPWLRAPSPRDAPRGGVASNPRRWLRVTTPPRADSTISSAAPHAASVLPAVQREHLLLAAVVCVSWGALVFSGNIDLPALLDILAGLLLMGAALLVPSRTAASGRMWWGVAAVFLAAAGFRYVQYLSPTPAMLLIGLLVAAVAVVSLTRLAVCRVVGGVVSAASVAALTTLGWSWGHASIDVFSALRVAANSLLSAHNPYTPTFPASVQTAPNLFTDQLIHFCYLPGAVLLAAPGQLVGDVRVVGIVASLTLVAFAVRLAMTSSRNQDQVFQVLALCVAMPLTVAMLQNAWLDMYSVAGFAGWLTLRHHHRRWAIVCLVVALGVKPTLLLALIPFWLSSRRVRQETTAAVAGTAVVILPFAAITGFHAFYQDVVNVYATLGFRYDGLTLSAWWYGITGNLIPVAFTLVVAALATWFALRRRPVDISQALIAGAFLTTAAFLLGKQAFLNYYFIPAWLLVLALAARRAPIDVEAELRLPVVLRALAPSQWAVREVSA